MTFWFTKSRSLKPQKGHLRVQTRSLWRTFCWWAILSCTQTGLQGYPTISHMKGCNPTKPWTYAQLRIQKQRKLHVHLPWICLTKIQNITQNGSLMLIYYKISVQKNSVHKQSCYFAAISFWLVTLFSNHYWASVIKFSSGFFQNVQVLLRKPHHIFSKQQNHSLHLKHTFLKNHPDVPCSLVKNGYLLCGDFSNCPKVFPFQKTAPPKPLVVVAQADPAGRLLVTSNVWGMKKNLHGLNQLGVVFCFWRKKKRIGYQQMGGKKKLGVLLYIKE